MKCPSCGFENPDRNIFCSFCGFRLPERVTPESVGAVPKDEPAEDPVEEPVAEATVEPEEVVEGEEVIDPEPEPVAGPEPKDEPEPEPHKAPESVPSPGTAPKHSSSTSSRKTDKSETSLTEDDSRLRIATVVIILVLLASVVFLMMPTTYDVEVKVQGHGSVSGTGSYEEGTVVELVAEGRDGYEFVSWSDGVTDPVRTITVDRDWNLTATFDRFFDIELHSVPEGSDHQDGKVLHVRYGTNLVLTPDPVEGYEFENWKYNGHDIEGYRYEIHVIQDLTIYIMNTNTMVYVSTWSENPDWGYFTYSNPHPYGKQMVLAAEPNEGYEFLGWYQYDVCVGTSTRLNYTPYEDVRFEARFGIIHDASFTVNGDLRVNSGIDLSAKYDNEIDVFIWEIVDADSDIHKDINPYENSESNLRFTPREPMHLKITRTIFYTDGEVDSYAVELIINDTSGSYEVVNV